MVTVRGLVRQVARPPVRKRIVQLLWLVIAVAITIRLSVMFGSVIPTTESYRGTERYFLDFRDTIFTPGRFLLGGGNPYDPDTYLAAHPYALPFSLYSPAWLVLAVFLAPLPYLVSIAAFQVISIGVAFLMLRVICKWAMPTLADIAVPVGLLWMNIWYPGRGSISVQLGTMFGALGVALVLRGLSRRKRGVDRASALGVALTLVKVQFGAIALVAIAAGRLRDVWRGVVGLVLLSAPILVACTVAAGGPIQFVRSVLRDLAVLTSEAAPTGLANPVQRRFDLMGQLARYGFVDPPLWFQLALVVLGLTAAIVVVRLTRDSFVVSTVVVTSMLAGIYHAPYDLIMLFIPIAVGIGKAVRRELTTIVEWVMLAAMVVVVLHLHTVSTFLLPFLDVRAADTIDLALVLLAMAGGVVTALRFRQQGAAGPDDREPALPDEAAAGSLPR